MSRLVHAARQMQRCIVFLCQECRGDLEPKPQAGSARCRYECQSCGLVWVYGSAGWERVQP